MSRTLRLAAAGTAAILMTIAGALPAAAVVVIDTSFTAAEGYADGKLQFQSGNAPTGAWLGQFNDPADGGTGNPSVDATAGVVNVLSGPVSTGVGDAFLRNLWSEGATGTFAGGTVAGEEGGAGFFQGDRIKVDFEYQFTLRDAAANINFFAAGVTDCFASCGFEASPVAGIKAAYNPFANGTVKVFTNQARAGFRGSDNSFALFLDSADIGIDNGFEGAEPIDLISDNLQFSYEAELIDAATDLWSATELTVTNLDTATVIAQATVDNPMALESFLYNTEPDDIFTPDIDEGGVARLTGDEMYAGVRWIDDATAGGSAQSGGFRFEYLPNLPSIDGDYNGDGLVNAADYTVWRDSNESVGTNLPADGNGDEVVDGADYTVWANNYGASAFPAASAIPEPSTLVLGALMAAGALMRRREF